MPSPIGHALGGAIVGVVLGGRPATAGTSWRWHQGLRRPVILLAVMAAVAPDIDFLWGRHNMETHSLGAALAAGLVAGAWCRQMRVGLIVALAWASHVAFDWLGSDDTAPLGVMALWPVTSSFYFADAFVFEAISRRYWRPGFLAHNLGAVVRELLMLGPLLALGVWRAGRHASKPS